MKARGTLVAESVKLGLDLSIVSSSPALGSMLGVYLKKKITALNTVFISMG